MFLCSTDDRVAGLLDPQIDDLESVIGQDDIDQIFSDVVHVALDGGEHDRAFMRPGLFFHLRLEISYRRLHHASRIEHRGQLHPPTVRRAISSSHPHRLISLR